MNIKTVEALRRTFPANYNLYYPEEPQAADTDCDLYIRILPDPASRIYSGKKKFELRKYVPKHKGFVFLFETGGRNAVTGCFYFEEFIADTVDNLWDRLGPRATSRERFTKYFQGKAVGVALAIKDVEKLSNPIPLEEIYNRFPNFPKVPHPYVYLYTQIGSQFSSFLRAHAPGIVDRNARS